MVKVVPFAAAAPASDVLVSDATNPMGDSVRLQPGGIARQIDEGGLGDFLGELRRVDLAQRRGIDQAEMAPDDVGKGVLGVLPGVAREQFNVGVAHVWKHIGADPRNPPRNLKATGFSPHHRQSFAAFLSCRSARIATALLPKSIEPSRRPSVAG